MGLDQLYGIISTFGIMNERIKQLALQALKHPDNDNDGLTIFDNDELKKFAELIVRECGKVIRAEILNDVFFGGKFQGAILKHFGVEE